MQALSTAGDAILADIIANPEDDTPRLVLADWLTDNGQPERGEFIRVQIELARLPTCPSGDNAAYQSIFCRLGCRRCACRQSERWLLQDHVWEFLSPLPGEPRSTNGEGNEATKYHELYRIVYTFSRGFVSHVKLSQSAWLRYGPVIARRCPVTHVKLSDRYPANNRNSYRDWYPPNPHDMTLTDPSVLIAALAEPLWSRLSVPEGFLSLEGLLCRGYESERVAKDDLSAACLRYAKETT